MDFYESISAYYDLIFPADRQTVEFIAAGIPANAGGEARILDLACGTGSYSLALAERGCRVIGIDLDRAMIESARRKGMERKQQVDFRVMDMLQAGQLLEPGFDLIFCIGNSLVHLESDKQIRELLSDCRNLLAPGGALIVQIINYDRILAQGLTSLPTLREESADLEFVRSYELEPDRKAVLFRTELRIGRGGERRVIHNQILLRILTSERLIELVEAAGFREPRLFGSFDHRPFDLQSLPLVLCAVAPL
jgi:SAM-dependent methyltransferase